MSGHFVRKKHICDLPKRLFHTPGDVWLCDECGAYWRYSFFEYWSKSWMNIYPRLAKWRWGE